MSADGFRRTVDLNELRRVARASASDSRPIGSTTSHRNGPLPSRAMSRAPFVVMFSATVLCLVIRFVPEVRFAPEVFTAVYSQARVIAWVPGDDGFLGFCLFIALTLTAVTASRRLVSDFVWVSSLTVVVVLTASSIAAVVRDGPQRSGIGIAVAICIALLLWQASRRLARAQPDTAPPRFAFGLVITVTLTVLPTLAVGRALFGRTLVDLAVVWDPRVWTIINPSTPWLWAAGSLVCVVIAIVISLLPPARSTHRLAKIVVGVLVAAVLATYVGPVATESAQQVATRLQTEDAATRLSGYCTLWSRPDESAPPTTVVLSGSSCSTIQVYEGSVLTSAQNIPFDLSSGPRFDTNRTLPTVVSAVYDNVLVVAAVRADGTPGVIGVDFPTGALLWQVLCSGGTQNVGLRFAGASEEDPGLLRQTLPGEGQGIFLVCDGAAQLLPPHP